jgi:hypothetical protein
MLNIARADLTNGKYGPYYQQYVIAAAGNDEYLILHQRKGLYMTATRGMFFFLELAIQVILLIHFLKGGMAMFTCTGQAR